MQIQVEAVKSIPDAGNLLFGYSMVPLFGHGVLSGGLFQGLKIERGYLSGGRGYLKLEVFGLGYHDLEVYPFGGAWDCGPPRVGTASCVAELFGRPRKEGETMSRMAKRTTKGMRDRCLQEAMDCIGKHANTLGERDEESRGAAGKRKISRSLKSRQGHQRPGEGIRRSVAGDIAASKEAKGHQQGERYRGATIKALVSCRRRRLEALCS
ncbi:hypothetical protein GOP47_0023632 [Adiantum capillus-veneris]|uniref:Uncharacterized protein n=1 Tax=Adiantum capillus-veneris TaxID=13818 RepID=A0A9D4U498_ADICA|nr:hypothetical protein GOP47_0023632 [Adiantum capillus-veneris]